MRRPEQDPNEPLLFDLPLGVPERKRSEEPAAERKRPTRAPAPPVPLSLPAEAPRASQEIQDEDGELLVEPGEGYAGAVSRLSSGAADLVVHVALGVVILLGCRGMGIRPTWAEGPAIGLFLLAFSFLYTVVPLAFWGHTLGMAWAGITSRNLDGEPLTFDQTARRWLGSVLTAATLGLPLLLSRGGRSLTDRLSGSATYPAGLAGSD
jgi:uncharacterized RDD family membrane protein YckC